MFNLSLEEGIVTLHSKKQTLCHFESDELDSSEFRHTVLLAKHLIKDHLVDFLVKNKLINAVA